MGSFGLKKIEDYTLTDYIIIFSLGTILFSCIFLFIFELVYMFKKLYINDTLKYLPIIFIPISFIILFNMICFNKFSYSNLLTFISINVLLFSYFYYINL